MEHTTAIHHDEHAGGGTKEIIKVTVILSVLTAVELALGFWMMKLQAGTALVHAIKGTIVILMLAKAFYIVGYFMHLKHEVRNLIMTIVVPLLLFVWFIIAFLYDGNSYKELRNTYNPYYKEKSLEKAPLKEEKHEEKKPAVE